MSGAGQRSVNTSNRLSGRATVREVAAADVNVDDIAEAEDAQSSLTGVSAGLFIGANRGLEPGEFWSGLIDDVRIYDRVVAP